MAKRFYKTVRVVGGDGGYWLRLDGRGLKTPARRSLILPAKALAHAIAEEWARQGDRIDPRDMPLTGLANTAIDRVADDVPAVIDEIAAFGHSDLLCYRAETPADLRARQDAGWQPLLTWAQERLGAELRVTAGVIPIDQDPAALAALRSAVAAHDALALTALRELVGISGSLILGLALAHGHVDSQSAWELSDIDAAHQMERWGEDEEGGAARGLRRSTFLAAARFLDLMLGSRAV